MSISATLGVLLLPLQALPRTGHTSPANGDTAGYWQQRVAYTIVATLDEPAQRIRARGTLRYVNTSPDTLREMYVHQYLNAFRPGSRWSAVDEREGRERFQRLPEPHHGYERFTAPVRVGGTAVRVEYPGAPDSTVARFSLPAPLAPADSIDVEFQWEARPSTLPRRQGRRGRHWDLSQWFPKVAVYDRGGWQPNALQPAGEFYGEFGTYDVTLVVAEDQVLGATGVPVSGDPGWSRVRRAGQVRPAAGAYAAVRPPPGPTVMIPAGYRAVRFYARDVHHFAWTASPDYRYDGGVYVRAAPPRGSGVPTWDTVSVHVLWRAGDDTTWGGLRAVRRTIAALGWLESLYGPYAYPQLTTNHRLDGGGSELPMLMMNGSASQGLILHEGGHMYTFGILANNEWRSGWMDEGATSYQTAWAQRLTPQERARGGIVDAPRPVSGYRGRGIRMTLPRFEVVALNQAIADILGAAQPIGTVAHEFRDFATYNAMIYDRSEVMHGQLRDLLGDSGFVAFNRDYYDRWALKHVDERAMRASVERVSGREADWFFEQWVHRTGLMDYQLRRVRSTRDGSAWLTEATVRRRGEYRHPMNVGVRTASGWTLARMSAEPYDEEVLRIATKERPIEVRLDPHRVTWDWDRRNDHRGRRTRYNFDWPFLAQADREKNVALVRPLLWYSEPGGVTVALRERGSYLDLVDRIELGVGYTVDPREPLNGLERVPYWMRFENLTIAGRPLIGLAMDLASLDALRFARVAWERERTAGQRAMRYSLAVTTSSALDAASAHLPEGWTDRATSDVSLQARYQIGGRTVARPSYLFAQGTALGGVSANEGYAKGEIAFGGVRVGARARFAGRVYAGAATDRIAGQRALYVSSADPLSTFFNDWWRPRGALLKRPGMNWLPLGGPALRGFRWDLAERAVAAANVEAGRLVWTLPVDGSPALWLNAFADAGVREPTPLVDAGIGVALRGRLYDRNIVVRLDAPLYVSAPALAIERVDAPAAGRRVRARWVLTFNDVW